MVLLFINFRWLARALSLSHTHTRSLARTLSPPPPRPPSLSPAFPLSLSPSLPLSLSRTHARTHTYTHTSHFCTYLCRREYFRLWIGAFGRRGGGWRWVPRNPRGSGYLRHQREEAPFEPPCWRKRPGGHGWGGGGIYPSIHPRQLCGGVRWGRLGWGGGKGWGGGQGGRDSMGGL